MPEEPVPCKFSSSWITRLSLWVESYLSTHKGRGTLQFQTMRKASRTKSTVLRGPRHTGTKAQVSGLLVTEALSPNPGNDSRSHLKKYIYISFRREIPLQPAQFPIKYKNASYYSGLAHLFCLGFNSTVTEKRLTQDTAAHPILCRCSLSYSVFCLNQLNTIPLEHRS